MRNGHFPIRLCGKEVGVGFPCLIIAEVAQAHDGSLGLAHSFIDAVADAGADAVKFQTHLAEEESTLEESFRIPFSYEDKTRYAYWKRMEFAPKEWSGLAKHALDRGLIFLSSPFSKQAVELLDRLGVPAWKVGSGEVANPELLQACLQTGKPIILSTGMSDWPEIEATVETIRAQGNPFALLQCTSKYPTPLSQVGLNIMEEFRRRFDVPVGLSDHSGTPYAFLAAMALGANLVETHVTFHRRMFGPDTSSSLTFDQLHFLTQARNAFHEMLSHPVDKSAVAHELETVREIFNKSVALKKNLKAGSIIKETLLTTKKPGSGIPASRIKECIGRRLKRNVTSDRVLRWDDLCE